MIFILLFIGLTSLFVALGPPAVPFTLRGAGRFVGWRLRRQSRDTRDTLLERAKAEEEDLRRDGEEWERVEAESGRSPRVTPAKDRDWAGVVGFFHPFCNAGGGGERVLWAAVRATQKRWPNAQCVIYTGDHDTDKKTMLGKVKTRFNIYLHPPKVTFLYLTTRKYVLSSTYPHLTLLGQSLGSIVLAYDAITLLVPDIFIDTMGYAFALAFVRFLFPKMPTAAYVHYPTISTDMLGSLQPGGQGVNGGAGTGLRGRAKRRYWELFARLYGWVGGSIDVVMANSSWTAGHIRELWGPSRKARARAGEQDIKVVFPPVAVDELEREIEVSPDSESRRGRTILYIAQFRPEKNHKLVVNAFAQLINPSTSYSSAEISGNSLPPPYPGVPGTRLVLVGSVRNSEDATRVYELRLLAHELRITEKVEFVLDASWPEILEWLRVASVGVNGMWNEHFGIGVVEYQAAGLISVVHDSGGPKLDIVKPNTGFHAETTEQFASAFAKALSLPADETLDMRFQARDSAKRFSEAVFEKSWIEHMEILVKLAHR